MIPPSCLIPPTGFGLPVSKQKKSPSCQAAKPGEHERTHTRLFAFKHLPSTGRDWVPAPEEVETGKRPRPED
jgi:hypothetical protein